MGLFQSSLSQLSFQICLVCFSYGAASKNAPFAKSFFFWVVLFHGSFSRYVALFERSPPPLSLSLLPQSSLTLPLFSALQLEQQQQQQQHAQDALEWREQRQALQVDIINQILLRNATHCSTL